MKKRSWVRILLWMALAIIGTPIVVITLVITLLYVPPVQRAFVDKACEEISQKSGYDVEIGSIRLSLPLKLKMTDYSMSKSDSVYVQGKLFDANISLLPLFAGRVEINYVSLEELDMCTREMLPQVSIDGRVGYARIVARDADLTKSVADIRQLYIADTDVDIAISDTIPEEESEPLQWVLNLHKGSMTNCRIGISMPHDTLKGTMYIDRLQLSKGCMDLGATTFAIDGLALSNSQIVYDKGDNTAEETPLDHIKLNNININANGLCYNSFNDMAANITTCTLEQPDGFTITDAGLHFTSNRDTLQLHKLEINSRNGSRIYGRGALPKEALQNSTKQGFSTTLSANINKLDLTRLVTMQIYDKLHYFNEQLLDAEIRASGNIHDIEIDTIVIAFPGVGTINANGRIKNILRTAKASGQLAFNGSVDNINRFIVHSNDSTETKAKAEGTINYDNGKIDAKVAINSTDGHISATGRYNIADTTYCADIDIRQFTLSDIVPEIPLHNLSMGIKAEGYGFDFFDNSTQYNVDITVDTLYFAKNRIHTVTAKASQADCVSSVNVAGHDRNLLFGIDATTTIAPTGMENRTSIGLTNVDFKEIGLVDSALNVSTTIDITATSDFKETHSLKVCGAETSIVTKQHRFNPANLALSFATSPAMTSIKVENGDLNIDGDMDCGYNRLFAALKEIATMNNNMMSGKSDLYHLHDYEKVLPCISLDFTCGERNMLHNFLTFNGIEAKGIEFDADISSAKGLNIKGDIIKFRNAGIALDSIKFATRQQNDRLTYIIGATELSIASDDDDNSQSALLYGSIKCDTITSNFILRDNIKKTDSKAGLTALIKPGNMHIHFTPEAMLFGAPFAFNRENYIDIGKAMSVNADVTFTGSNENGFHLYTTPDEKASYNINLDIFNIDLEEIANAVPGIPDITGKLFSQLNYRQSNDNNVFTSNTKVDSLTYNGNIIGNERIELIYSPKASGAHTVRCDISHNGTKVTGIGGYLRNDRFIGNISLTRLPLSITQAFIDKEGVILNGYINGKMNFSGRLSDMKSQGYLQFDSAYAYSPMLGAILHPAEETIMIEESKVNLKNYHIYDKANTPFVINGNVDIANLLNPKLSLRLNATNYEILNTPQKAGNMVYGKMYVDLRSMIRGTLDDIRMMGDLTILSKSNFAYVIPETAFDSNKDLDGLVEFVNFNDTTAVEQQEQPKIDLGDITANLNIRIQEGARLSLDFDSSRESYVSIEGDGNLNATYDNRNGFGVTGIYNLSGGQVKLTLPIIPLKTFYIQEGGRLTWTGDLFNPTLDVTALEKTTVSVEMDDNSIQPVVFNTGVVVSNTINDLAIDFTMSSPENAAIQSQLNELDRETLSRYAVAMIITGTYMGGRQGVTAANALSSFLDAKINEISGSAIKNLDVNIGINDALNAQTGNTYTNYSFSFSKRFFNDRITVVIGGEVNSGDHPDKTAGNNTFINNVSLEWKLNDSGNRYIRIFYDKNYQSVLEGEITETGIGYVYKRKLNKLKELFMFKRKNRKNDTYKTNKARVKQ